MACLQLKTWKLIDKCERKKVGIVEKRLDKKCFVKKFSYLTWIATNGYLNLLLRKAAGYYLREKDFDNF